MKKTNVLLAIALFTVITAFAEDEVQTQVKETEWCTVTAPKSAKPGDTVSIVVKIKADAVKQDSVLKVDMHKFIGTTRKPGGGPGSVKLKAGEAIEHVAKFKVPADASSVAFPVYVSPSGGWKDRLLSTEISVKVAQ